MYFLVSVLKLLKHRLAVILSTIYRQVKIDAYFKNHKIKKLQLGCGDNSLRSWLNSDKNGIGSVVPIDVTRNFPLSDSSFHYVFCEHLIEHLIQDQGKKMLAEIIRILKPGGKVRIATPDLKFLIDLYTIQKTTLQKKYIRWTIANNFNRLNQGEESYVINNFFNAWGHQFIYDFETLKSMLEQTGFIKITRFRPGESRDPNLKNIESHWRAIGKDFNSLETFVVEATKQDS